MPGLEGLLTRLSGTKLRFVVVGGYAAVAHGATVLTQDMDICMPLDEGNLAILLAALSDLHPVHRTPPGMPAFDESALGSTGKNLYLDTDWGHLDRLSEVRGVGGFDEVFRQSDEVPLGDATVRLLGLDALIRAKDAMNRPKDREAVVQLRAIRERRSNR